jgi:hypothetical protein
MNVDEGDLNILFNEDRQPARAPIAPIAERRNIRHVQERPVEDDADWQPNFEAEEDQAARRRKPSNQSKLDTKRFEAQRLTGRAKHAIAVFTERVREAEPEERSGVGRAIRPLIQKDIRRALAAENEYITASDEQLEERDKQVAALLAIARNIGYTGRDDPNFCLQNRTHFNIFPYSVLSKYGK